jgi:SAM-dependent methyltransferase
MSCFNKDYSNLYDLIYKKKKYKKEFFFIKRIINKYLKSSSNILDLGCGTGNYSNLMTKLGLQVVGVDKSEHMLSIARNKYKKNRKINFFNSSIQNLNLKKEFDIVSALFHILSYQTTSKDIRKFFLNSRNHLKKNGLLVFDFWFKKGVLNLKLPLKTLTVENNKYRLHRITKPKWFEKKDQIHDFHEMIVINKKSKKTFEFKEVHKMRYFQLSAIKKYLKVFNFKYLLSLDLMTNKFPDKNSWGALVVAKKI